MEGVPSWMKSMLHKRIDLISQRMHENSDHQAAWKEADALFREFKSSFSEEQLQQFVEWEDCMNLQMSKEKEEMYVRGLWDGFQLCVSLDESLHSISDREPFILPTCCSPTEN